MENETLVPQVVVIGYGNTLRSDDGAGQVVAEAVKKWGLPNVRSHSVHQLTPELAEPISTAKLVIFVDAYPVNSKDKNDEIAIQVQAIQPTETKTQIGHTAEPRSLLSLTQIVYGVSPSAWWILIPAINFEFGEQLSLITQNGIKAALEQINQLIQPTNLSIF
ncbi:MAG TPA: hydrogenase maturation protease [Coleofasciculaceae cyanobacterium]